MNKSTSSIARKLNLTWTVKKIFTYVIMDIFMLAASVIGWVYYVETAHFGSFSTEAERGFTWEQTETDSKGRRSSRERLLLLESLSYEVYYTEDTYREIPPLSAAVYPLFVILRATGIVLLGFEGVSLIATLLFGDIGIRRHLKPLDDIARQTEMFNRLSFDEGQFANLESAIEHIDITEQEAFVHTGNKDLEGVEMALNNLLTHMREVYRQQSRFVSDASHELRTPIAVIQGYANMLDRWGKEDEKVLQESIEAIKHESEHMKRLVEQLLFLARGDAGRNPMDKKDIPLTQILREAYEEAVMIDKTHLYKMEDRGEDTSICADEAMIKQLARILLDNAAKYTPEKGEIRITCGRKEGSRPYFSIQDEGIGMTDKEVGHVFERFYRSDEARSSKNGGTGLGLSIAKWIVDKHGGYVEILSRQDIGTRITVVFPKKDI